jgi:FHS family L-fucose permease-like MFS transporter
VGAQVGTWSYFIPYVESATGVGDKAAGYMLTGTLAAFAVGRFSSARLMRRFHARTMLGVYALANVALSLVAVTKPRWLDHLVLGLVHPVFQGLAELAARVAPTSWVAGAFALLSGVTAPGWLCVDCLLMTSLFMSIMFPTIFALGLKGMGEKTKTAGSFLVMAILGGAALTKLMGMLPLLTAYLVPVACYIGVALYAWLFAEAKEGEAA